MTRRHLGGVAMVLVIVGARLLAQQVPPPPPPPPPSQLQPTGAGVIGGVVTVAGSGGPARSAQVRLVSVTPRLTRTVTTDDDGRFVIDRLPAADYTLSALKPGFLEMVYGARKPGANMPGAAIKLAAAQKIETIGLALPRGGAINGKILDEFGDPVNQARVTALRFAFKNGERTLTQSAAVFTDDRGQFRLPGLMPGDYLISALHEQSVAMATAAGISQRARMLDIAAQTRRTGDAARADELEQAVKDQEAAAAVAAKAKGYVPVYYPGVLQPAGASPVALGLGQDLMGIDVRLQRTQTATVAGTVTSAEASLTEINVALIDPTMPIGSVGVWFSPVKGGRFTFYGVQPGTYVLSASASLRPSPADPSGVILTATADITVAPDGAVIPPLHLARGVTVSGSLKQDTLRGVVDPAKLRVRIEPISTSADWEMPAFNQPVDAQGRFVVNSVPPGRFRIAVTGLPAGWSLASAVFGGRDAADYHLVIEPGKTYTGVLTFTDRTAEVYGSVVNASGAPAADQTIIIFPEDRTMWVPSSRRIQLVRPGADGKYSVRNLPPGDYRVAAVLDPESGIQFDREFLAKLVPLAASVKVGEGERRTQDLVVR